MTSIILHIPHSSTFIPFYDGYTVDKDTINNEINLLTDWFTDELFDLPYTKIITPFSRVFCDVERFHDDSEEIMSKYGMGICYTHFDNGKLMREVNPELRNRIKNDFYDHHHRELEKAVDECLSKNNKAIIIDCHSFPHLPLERDLQKELPRPDFCIGTNDFHTPEPIADYACEFITKHGFNVKFDNPYSGTIIPLKYFNKENKVHGLMIEVNRNFYMNLEQGKIIKKSNFQNIKHLLDDLIINILNCC